MVMCFIHEPGSSALMPSGNLVNPSGATLQGFQADANGVITGTIGDLVLTTTQQVGT